MGKTLLELFKSKSYGALDNNTAQEFHSVRNIKKTNDVRFNNSSQGVILTNTSGIILNAARKVVSAIDITRKTETAFEQESSGLRVLGAASQPVLYSAATTNITPNSVINLFKNPSIVYTDLMRLTFKTTPSVRKMKSNTVEGKQIGGLVDSLRNLANNITDKAVPPIPSYIYGKLKGISNGIQLKYPQERMNQLADLNGTGLPPVVSWRDIVKFGKSNDIINSAVDNSISFRYFHGNAPVGDSELSTFTDSSIRLKNIRVVNYGAVGDKSFNTTSSNIDIQTNTLDVKGHRYSDTIDPTADTVDNRFDLSTKQQIDREKYIIPFIKGAKYSSTKLSDEIKRDVKLTDDELGNNRKRNFERRDDALNLIGVTSDVEKFEEDLDFIPLIFQSVDSGKAVSFRATVGGMNESFSPAWDSTRFMGSAFESYTYTNTSRSFSFNFKVYSMSVTEHKMAWERLNFLTGLVYPQRFTTTNAIVPPLIYFTLGSLYKRKAAFIESLSYGYDDSFPWQINPLGNKTQKSIKYDSNGQPLRDMVDVDVTDYVLPMVVDASITIKLIQTRSEVDSSKYYSFTPIT